MENWMKLAIKEAKMAKRKGEVPVGAVLVVDGKVIAKAHNSPISKNDPTDHAEILVLRKGGKKIGNYRLNEAELYVTKEPCLMCLGAIINARVKKLIYGAKDKKGGAFSKFSVDISQSNHKLIVIGEVMEEETASILRDFFREKR